MGFFSRLFKPRQDTAGVERLWAEFDDRQNDRLVLREKALRFAPILVELASNQAKSIQEQLPQVDIDLLFTETLILNFHPMDRPAFSVLEADARNHFIDPLIDEVMALLASLTNDPDNRKAFLELYSARQREYADLSFVAQENSAGGQDIRRTIGWRLAENLGVADGLATEMALHYLVATHHNSVIGNLQVVELLRGA